MLDRRARSALSLLAVCSLATLPACADREVAAIPTEAVGETASRFVLGTNRNLDLLFVVDDSNSMLREQSQMARHFRTMIEVLEGLPDGGLPNLHIGVVSTDVGPAAGCPEPRVPAGELRNQPNPSDQAELSGCAGPRDRYLIDVLDEESGAREVNYPADSTLADSFACIATLGAQGCRFEAPLEAMRRALAPDNLANQGFLRDNALLAIVILSDEDDCSASDPRMFGSAEVVDGHRLGPAGNFRCFSQGVMCEDGTAEREGVREGCEPRDSEFLTAIDEYVDDLRKLRPDPRQLVVAGIVGAPRVEVGRTADGNPALAPSCAEPETAFPPVRTDAFLSRFEQHVRTEICADDLSPAMKEIGEYIAGQLVGRCLKGEVLDLDETTPGIQPECVAVETVAPGSANPVRTRLPACPGAANQPCWRVEVDPVFCSGNDEPSHLEVSIDYPANVTRAPDTAIEIRCRSR